MAEQDMPKVASQRQDYRAMGIPVGAPTIAPLRSSHSLTEHPCYEAAKSGDPASAASVARDLLSGPIAQRIVDTFDPAAVFLPAQAQEPSGPNALAVMLAGRATIARAACG
jgi:hypothetical protein